MRGCLISHAELVTPVQGCLYEQKKWYISKRYDWNFRIAWRLNSSTWDVKVQLSLFETHQCIYSSMRFQQFERKVEKTCFSEEPFRCYLLQFTSHKAYVCHVHLFLILQMQSSSDFIGAASKESASMQKVSRSTSHLLDLCKIQLF